MYVDGVNVGTVTAIGGAFSLAQPSNLSPTTHTVYATAPMPADGTSPNSNTTTNTFT